MNKERLIASIKKGEGCSLRAYRDTLGVYTIGWGRNMLNMRISQSLADEWLKEDLGKAGFVPPVPCHLRTYKAADGTLLIGWGRNLQTLHISQSLADEWLQDDINSALISAQVFLEWPFLDTDARQNAFVEMNFNLGPLRLGGFKNMLAAIKMRDWTTVAKEALNSKWATQVGQRAIRLIAMLQTGSFQE